ncbi:MAG: SIS domain-containing protein [Bacteroidales bacterium]|jgi:tagatose-6-phosphate ketose/aldose isomerase|nr:SIS domain-containing protein [Bacteroidales bacterium]MCI2134726.1 SIS domain-containing protein [Bacteroidales bacterium]MDY6320315.1 SIS domain-containing protein [Bacteroidales bacterium]HCN53872.1 sugar isomerase [Prevotella sp.]
MFSESNYTIKEILQQSSSWIRAYKEVVSKKEAITEFFRKSEFSKDSEIILTGAGSSEFVAQTLESIFIRDGYSKARSLPTTSIVSAPEYYLSKGKKFVISFARSGDSPESVAAYEIVNMISPGSSHLIITCNGEGKLASLADEERDFALILPPETNDKSLAMTSSFSTMLISCLMCKNIDHIEKDEAKVRAASDFASALFGKEQQASIAKLCKKKIERGVVLGSGPLVGIARECHLKMQELTDGQVMCSYDSFLGLRHGPKAVIKPNTLVVYLVSDNPYTRRYERDLIEQINKEHKPIGQVIVSNKKLECNHDIDMNFAFNGPFNTDEDEYLYTAFVVIGQLLGYCLSITNGYNPDSPSRSHTISRIVSGVKIYPYEK